MNKMQWPLSDRMQEEWAPQCISFFVQWSIWKHYITCDAQYIIILVQSQLYTVCHRMLSLTGWPSQQGIIELKADWICIVQYSAPSHCVSEQASIHPPLLHVSMAPHHLSTKNITSHNKRLAKTIDKMCYYYQSVSVLLQDECFILKLSRNWLLLLSAIQIIAKPFSQSSVRFGRGFMPQIWLKHLQKGWNTCKMGA